MTEATAKATTPYEQMGGAPVFLAICNRFYDLMDQDPAYADLRAMHAADLAFMREALAQFLIGWAGGPRDWFEHNPGKCMMSLHAPMPITPATARQWADAMSRAIETADVPNRDLATVMAEKLSLMAEGMGRREI